MSGTDALVAARKVVAELRTRGEVGLADDLEAALAELRERAGKLENVAEEARWVVEHVYPHGSSLKDALAAVAPSGGADAKG